MGRYVARHGITDVNDHGGHKEAIVWSVGVEGANRLHGFDGSKGKIVYAGGLTGDVIGSVRCDVTTHLFLPEAVSW